MTTEKAIEDRLEYERLQRQADGATCISCGDQVVVAWINGKHALKCSCPEGPKAFKNSPSEERRAQSDLGQLAQRKSEVLARTGASVGLASRDVAPPAPMTIDQFRARQDLVKAVVGEMLPQVHFGVIPGTKDKSLWEPGAEYLRAAFNIQWDYDVIPEIEDFDAGEFRYLVRSYQLLGPGVRVGGWSARAWSKESRFARMPAADLANNVMDRAIKRAFVNMIRNVTGTSGYFKEGLDTTVAAAEERGKCPKHGVPFQHRTGEKDGKPYDFWACPKKDGGKYCDQKPQNRATPPDSDGVSPEKRGVAPAKMDATEFWARNREAGRTANDVELILGKRVPTWLEANPGKTYADAFKIVEAAMAERSNHV